VILRLVRGRVVPGRHASLRTGLAESLPQARSLVGVIDVLVGLRAGAEANEFVVISTWASADDAVAALGPEARRVAAVPNVTEHLDVRTIELFELDESVLVEPDRTPVMARIGIGSIELGMDVEIQQELRNRLHTLGDEVVGAYVGRRIRENEVDVAFVTLWSAVPTERDLDEPLFPDVSDRYTAYAIEVYGEVYRA